MGAADYLVKPVTRDHLLATLEVLTRGRDADGVSKVLVIDDDPLAIALIETILEPAGFRVVGALGGEEGMRAAKVERPALIILDLLMPGVDGFDVLERLGADPMLRGIPVVVLTSKTIDARDRERLSEQVAHLARKAAFDRAEFVELVRRYCERETV